MSKANRRTKGRTEAGTEARTKGKTKGRTEAGTEARRIRRAVRNSAIFLAVIFIAVIFYIESSNSILSNSEANPGYGSSTDGTAATKAGKADTSKSDISKAGKADISKSDISEADSYDTYLPGAGLPSDIEISEDDLSHVDFSSRIDLSDVYLSNELMLVNSENIINEDFAADLTPAYRIVPLSASDIKMNGIALEAVTKLFEEAEEKGYKDFFVNSGFRSFQKQKELYDSAEDKSYVQEPGASEHQTGYGLDIAYKGLSGKIFDTSPQGKWLMENAHKYGFILRYPKNKTDITKISFEPWHYRYIGIPHSYYCYENDLCLEEYISFLAKGGSYSISIDKINYTVYYATENDGFIDVPADISSKVTSCRVSSDNTGGYVVVAMG